MEAEQLLLQIAIILVAARVCGEIALKLKSPALIGEIIAGIIIGPSLLGWVEHNQSLNLLAEIGIILLLFEVGIETEVDRLLKAGVKSAIVATSGFVLPFILGFVTSYWVFSLDILVALFIGGTLTATSIGITVRILTELNKHRAPEGQIALGAAVIDDILGIFLLAVLYEFSTSGQVSLSNMGLIIFYVAIFFVISPLLARLISPILMKHHNNSRIPGIIPTMLVSLVMLFAYLANRSGAPELLGGFVAGIAFSRRFILPFGSMIKTDEKFSHEIRAQMKPIIQLFTPVFFVSVGLSFDFTAVDWGSGFVWIFSLVLVLVAILGKLISGLLINEKLQTRIAVGMAMVPRGEVGLIFAELGRVSGIINPTVYAALLLVIMYTTLASPLWIKWFYRYYPRFKTRT